MSDLANLRASCQAVLARHQSNTYLDLQCAVCQQRVRGQDESMKHYITAHSIHPVHFDDVADLEGLLSCLRRLLFPNGAEASCGIRCPVCLESFSDEVLWAAHIDEAGHNKWNPESIPSLVDFCIGAKGLVSAVKEEEEEEEEEEEVVEDEIVEKGLADESDEEGWDAELAQCLLCDDKAVDCIKHMIDAHTFDFRAAVRARGELKDIYDIIRVVNVIRRCVSRGVCPWHYGDTAAAEEELETCRQDIVKSSLEAHLRAHPQHSLPRIVPQGDRDLIPALPGDVFISSVVMGGDLIPEDEVDPDYPMVPTITEMAQRRMANNNTAKENLL